MADFKGPSQTNFYQAGRQTLIQIGTSGWTYKHWKGTFYPEGLPQRKWLEFYAARFSTVEINASFYHIPKASTAQGWAERTPPDFRFAVKVSRLITHVRKLTNCEEKVDWFFRELWPMNKKVQATAFKDCTPGPIQKRSWPSGPNG